MVKAGKDGVPHVRGCKCPRCRGRRNRKSGLSAQRSAARSLGIPQLGPHLASDEELYPGELRVEVKSGAQVRPMATAFEKARKQSEAARAVGDVRPFLMVSKVQPEGKGGIVAFRVEDLTSVAYALANHLGLLVE